LTPVAVNVDEFPKHIAVELATGIKVGLGVTTIFTVCVDVQPLTKAPVTEYKVVEAGVSISVVPVIAPGFHV
jgi:hypothetical protein